MNNIQTASTIKSMCRARNITVNTLLSDCNIRKSLIYDMEKRDQAPSSEILERIADYLHCSVDHLLGRDEKKPTPEDGDGLDDQDRQLIELMKLLSADQKEFLLAQLLTLTGQGK